MPRRVLVTVPLQDPGDLDLIRAVAPDLEITYLPYLAGDAERSFRSQAPLEEIAQQPPTFPPAILAALRETEILLTLDVPTAIRQYAPILRWIQHFGSGTDHYRGSGVHEAGILLTSAKGVAAGTIAEFVLAQWLALSKQFPARYQLQQARQWKRLINRDLAEQTLGILGLGEIGQRVAALAKAFGARVVATKRHVTAPPPTVDRLFPREELLAMLAESDALVVCVAYTPETRGIISTTELAALRPGAYLINVSRGGVVDEAALLAALRSGQIAGAALDVFVQEPLPSDSPFWTLPNVLVTPHNAVGVPNYSRLVLQLFVDNLRRYLRGEPLRNLVTPESGY